MTTQTGGIRLHAPSSHGQVEVFTPPTEDSHKERWPWHCQARPPLIINGVLRSPEPAVVDSEERNFSNAVNQWSYTEITEDQYRLALKELESVFDATKGDLLGDWPMFETSLRRKRPSSDRADKFTWKPNDLDLLSVEETARLLARGRDAV